MRSTLGKWVEASPSATAGLAATENAKITIGISEIKTAFFQLFDDMILLPLTRIPNRHFSPDARHFWRAPGVVSCVGKNFVRRLKSDASRFGNGCWQWAQERSSAVQVPPQQHGIVFMHGVVAVLHEHAAPIPELHLEGHRPIVTQAVNV